MDNQKDYLIAKRFIDRAINKARKERDLRGYRENLGYDNYPKLLDYLSKLEISYTQQADLEKYFTRLCDEL